MKIAFLATGDELIHGDTLNTTHHEMAKVLASEGFSLGLQLTCCDKEQEMVQSLQFLSEDHEILIITGGLGPTSDDRTRFALAKHLDCDLVEKQEALDHIQSRLTHTQLSMNAGNRQQALFPENSQLLPNAHGTAMGAIIEKKDKTYILLPGPPRECLPLFNQYVLPQLSEREHSQKQVLKWRLFGVAESEIGEQLDTAIKPFDCKTGYRLDMPYVEFKVFCRPEEVTKIKQTIQPLVEPYLMGTPQEKASDQLRRYLSKLEHPILIEDDATGGVLQTLLQHPSTYGKVFFHHSKDTIESPTCTFSLSGLDAYWTHQPDQSKTTLVIKYHLKDKTGNEVHQLPYRSAWVIHSAAEWSCFRLLQLLL